MTFKPKHTDIERFIDWVKFLGVDGDAAWGIAVERLDHYGVEYCSVGDKSMAYLNQGDTYDYTLVYDDDDGLICTSWGDWYECAEQAYCEENCLIRCPNCDEFNDRAEDWRDTVCKLCGYEFN